MIQLSTLRLNPIKLHFYTLIRVESLLKKNVKSNLETVYILEVL